MTYFLLEFADYYIRTQLFGDTKLSTTEAVKKASAIAAVTLPKSRLGRSNRRDVDLNTFASLYNTAYLYKPFLAGDFAKQWED